MACVGALRTCGALAPLTLVIRPLMELASSHQISFDAIRRLAIECHSLDLDAFPLLQGGTHFDTTSRTRAAYQELLTSKLLSLAVAIRTKFYQSLVAESSIGFVLHSGIFFKEGEDDPENVSFSIKDVCDKIIHANSVERLLSSSQDALITDFKGVQGKREWLLSISISLFTEGVLNWIEHLEEEQQYCNT